MAIDRKIYDLRKKRPRQGSIKRARLLRDENQTHRPDARADIAFDMARIVYDFMFNNFNREGYDGLGKSINIYIHAYRRSGVAKFYHSAVSDHVVFGDGDRKHYNSPLEALDIVAHEMMHGYFTYLCPVHYGFTNGGAILEHLCDVFGVMIRQHDLGNAQDWVIGANYALNLAGVRDLKSPNNVNVLLPAIAKYNKRVKYRNHNNLYQNAGILSAAFVAAEEDYQDAANKSALPIWYVGLQSIPRNCDFPAFAQTMRNTAAQNDPAAIASVNTGFNQVGL